ncbi:MAG: hypothetical protein ACK41O_14640, partial [Runella zeae]
ARNALKYKIDAEYFHQQVLIKTDIILQKDTVIAKKSRKIFWKSVENWAWRSLAVIITYKALKPP